MAIAAIVKTKTNNKMSKALDALKALKAYFQGDAVNMEEDEATPEAVNMNLELEDGEFIYVESEDGELEGKPTNAPNGTHRLRDGRSITVEDGMVVSVQEAEDEEKKMLKEQVAELQAQLQEMNGAKAEAENKYSELEAEVMNIKKMITSNATPLAKHPRYNQAQNNGKPTAEAKEEPRLVGADRLRKQVLKR